MTGFCFSAKHFLKSWVFRGLPGESTNPAKSRWFPCLLPFSFMEQMLFFPCLWCYFLTSIEWRMTSRFQDLCPFSFLQDPPNEVSYLKAFNVRFRSSCWGTLGQLQEHKIQPRFPIQIWTNPWNSEELPGCKFGLLLPFKPTSIGWPTLACSTFWPGLLIFLNVC